MDDDDDDSDDEVTLGHKTREYAKQVLQFSVGGYS